MKISKSYFYFALIVALTVLAGLMILPFISAILFAAILAYMLTPIHETLKKYIRLNPSAFLLTITVLGASLIALKYGIELLLRESTKIYLLFSSFDLNTPSGIPPEILQFMSLGEISQLIMTKFITYFSGFLEQLPTFIISFFIFFLSLFYFIRDGRKIKEFLRKSMPFPDKVTARLIDDIKRNVNAFLYVQIVIGIIQGIVAGIGFYFIGLPYPLVAAVIVTLLGILPLVGPPLLYVPVGAITILEGDIYMGAAIILYGLLVVSTIDNVVRPYLTARRSQIHPLIILIGVFGGIKLFGLVGVVLGPVLLAVLVSALTTLQSRGSKVAL